MQSTNTTEDKALSLQSQPNIFKPLAHYAWLTIANRRYWEEINPREFASRFTKQEPNKKIQWTNDMLKRIKYMLSEGESREEIAFKFRVSPATLNTMLQRKGLAKKRA